MPKVKVEVTEEEFRAFVKVQRGGRTNMFDVKTVCRLSGGVLTRETCMAIMKDYEELTKQYVVED